MSAGQGEVRDFREVDTVYVCCLWLQDQCESSRSCGDLDQNVSGDLSWFRKQC